MMYELIKAAHLASLFVWIGGMITVAVSLRCASTPYMIPLRAYDRAVTTPAMILAMLFGILLGLQGGWFASTWLIVKLLFVLGLFCLHGAMSGRLRRAIWEIPSKSQSGNRVFVPVGFATLVIIVLLVILKPW